MKKSCGYGEGPSPNADNICRCVKHGRVVAFAEDESRLPAVMAKGLNRRYGKRGDQSDDICPWCQSRRTTPYKWKGFGYNGVRAYTKVCLDCGTSFDIDRS